MNHLQDTMKPSNALYVDLQFTIPKISIEQLQLLKTQEHNILQRTKRKNREKAVYVFCV